ncbi:MAG: DUF371 domain-containing protein [Desulfurococcales archaeon]|nr:DUF371 domain-containing protein [Desulfurococcales archaeon]
MKEIEGKWISFTAWGHENIKALHKTTLELTRESHLTPRGDCIIGVRSELAVGDLPGWFKAQARDPEALIVLVLCSARERICDSIVGSGHPGLSFEDRIRIIVRKSTYIDGKTLMIKASKSARDLRRDLVQALARGDRLDAYLTVIKEPMEGFPGRTS